MREKCPNTEFFLVHIFLYWGIYVFSPNTAKYGPEITLYLDTFHAVHYFQSVYTKVLKCSEEQSWANTLDRQHRFD